MRPQLDPDSPQRVGDVDLLHEAVADDDTGEVGIDPRQAQALLVQRKAGCQPVLDPLPLLLRFLLVVGVERPRLPLAGVGVQRNRFFELGERCVVISKRSCGVTLPPRRASASSRCVDAAAWSSRESVM